MTTCMLQPTSCFAPQEMTTLFGNPGSNELTFLDRLPEDLRYVLALHEGAGLAMAECYSQVSGRPVLVSLHAAAGVGQAMGSLVNAQISGTPLVVMSGQQARPLITLQGQLTKRGRHAAAREGQLRGTERVRRQLEGHDLVLVVGAQVFRYHTLSPGSFLPDGAQLVAITSDPDIAARAPVGDAVVGDPGHALTELGHLVQPAERPLPAAREQSSTQPGVGGALTRDQVLDALAAERPEDALFVSEAPSLGTWWDRVPLRRPGSYSTSAAGGLGFGLPGAMGAALAAPERHVVALSGDGSAHYSITALWTAAQQRARTVFVIIRNGVYGVLQEFGQYLHTEGLPGTTLPGVDFVSLAAGYGVAGTRVSTPETLKAALRTSFDPRRHRWSRSRFTPATAACSSIAS